MAVCDGTPVGTGVKVFANEGRMVGVRLNTIVEVGGGVGVIVNEDCMVGVALDTAVAVGDIVEVTVSNESGVDDWGEVEATTSSSPI